jgi:hypothetical protein
MNKRVADILILLVVPVFTFFYYTATLEHQDTWSHERVHALICEEYYKGNPVVTTHFMGGGETRCYNATDKGNPLGNQLDTQNEITGYNLSSIRHSFILLITFIIVLIGVIITRDND